MLIEERQRRVIEMLQENPQITVKELAVQLSFSEPTIRRDLTELHKKGIITKLYGGAVLNKDYADAIGADKYAKDAMETVRYAEEVNNGLN